MEPAYTVSSSIGYRLQDINQKGLVYEWQNSALFNILMKTFHVIWRHKMKTVCRPSDRDVNWRSPVQGKSHQVKEPYGNSNWLLVGLHPAAKVYNVHRLCRPRKFRRNGRKEGSILRHCP